MDRVYGFLFAVALVAGIPAMLAEPSLAVLYVIMISFAGFASRGVAYYRRLFSRSIGGVSSGDPKYALLGFLPASLGLFFSWTTDLLLGLAVAVLVAVAEETFRAGAVVVLRNTGLSGYSAVVAANVAWVAYHFVLHEFSFFYLFYLAVGAVVFTFVLVKAGVGVAALAHLLANGFAAWVAVSSSSASGSTTSLAFGAFVVVFALLLGVSGRAFR